MLSIYVTITTYCVHNLIAGEMRCDKRVPMKGCHTKGHLEAGRPDREAIVQMYNPIIMRWDVFYPKQNVPRFNVINIFKRQDYLS